MAYAPAMPSGDLNSGEKHMSILLSRVALGVGGALIAGAALAQTTPAPAPAASPYPPTATIANGYPGVGPADNKLRSLALPNGKKVHVLPATLETTQWGWFDNAQPPVLRVNSGDTIALETMMHSTGGWALSNQPHWVVSSVAGSRCTFLPFGNPTTRSLESAGPTPG